MTENEFYVSKEAKGFGEFKAFKAEIYPKADEIKRRAPEIAFTGAESAVALPQKESKVKKKASSGDSRKALKRFFDNISKSISNAATPLIGTVVAATSAVVVCATVFTAAPEIKLVELEAGADSVYYCIEIERLSDDVDYDIVVSGRNGSIACDEVVTGTNEGVIEGLMPDEGYTLSIIGKDFENGDTVTYFKKTFVTTKFEYPAKYGAEFALMSAGNIRVDWGTEFNTVHIPTGFKHSEGDGFCYRVTLYDGENVKVASKEGDAAEISFDVPSEVKSVYAVYEKLYKNGDIYHSYGTQKSDKVILEPVNVRFLSKELVGNGMYKISYVVESALTEFESYDWLKLIFMLGENGEYELDAGGVVLNKIRSVYVEMSPELDEFTARAELSYTAAYGGGKKTLVTEPHAYLNETEFNPSVTVYKYYSTPIIEFNFIAKAPEGAYVLLVDKLSGESEQIMGYYHSVDLNGTHEYTYQLYSAQGEPLSEQYSVEIDGSVDAQYEAGYSNPGNLYVTYNSDGTMNIYVKTGFSCDADDVYYEMLLNNITFSTRDAVAGIEDLPFDSYYITYSVVCERNGVKYYLESTTPSGGVEFSSWGINGTVNGSEVELNISSGVIIGEEVELEVNGKAHSLKLSDMTVDEYGDYIYAYNAGEEISSAILTVYIRHNSFTEEELINGIGQGNYKGELLGKYKVIIEGETL